MNLYKKSIFISIMNLSVLLVSYGYAHELHTSLHHFIINASLPGTPIALMMGKNDPTVQLRKAILSDLKPTTLSSTPLHIQCLSLNVFKGHNAWSTHKKKLIEMNVDLQELEFLPTDTLEGFYERLKNLIPSLIEHRCSIGKKNGFFLRVQQGTWIGHVIEHVALEILTLAGMDCRFGRTRSTGEPGRYTIIFEYIDKEAGIYAAQASTRIVEALINSQQTHLTDEIQRVKELSYQERFGKCTQ